jgi:hypothetical protein
MIRTYLYKKYNSEDVLVLAHLKHGTRWLEEQESYSTNNFVITNKTIQKIAIELQNELFVKKDITFNSSKIKIGKCIVELKHNKLIIVYRNPYEAFYSALTTASQTDNFLDKNNICNDNDILNDKKEILNTIMLNSGHFTFFLWRIILSTLEEADPQLNIEFVELKDLSACIQLELLKYKPYTKKHYNFDTKETNILNLSKEELIKECKKSNKKLWDKIMLEIELDNIALNTLLKKYKVYKN